ncbi:1-acyl-sn-glycerol-3-phosphate acyltransferase [Arcicella aurantiaca]|uniref:1-acyl-sn-glycerol-3-phosphate acyltransferase n=1 Tax=Arcicella aurantiaca TaxID=591202 RepID=A0A316E9T2_9BACT|nr:lysophospholipid acyltransferase family protein [Arcicella aurantiaca]PWK26408.1 1-acyl-sn-glycerol-3-phosphate acyltransferase [Arcicella aurantiaca]
MRILIFLYTLWATFWFVFLFLLLFPLFWIFLQKNEWKPYAHYLNRLWGKLFFPLIGMPIKVEYEFEPDKNKAYVFCANHFSYMDIASMGMVIKNYYAFVGKASIKSVPLFGYMFAKLHIQVDRNDKNSRATSLNRSIRALQSGRSIMIFPEGGIKSPNFPQMHLPLKDGAFVMAIQQQVPLVPITFLNNYKIMHDNQYAVYPQTLRAVVHKPIETKGMTQADVDVLRQTFYDIVQTRLNKYELEKV